MALEPIIEDACDLKQAFTTEQVQQPPQPPSPPPPHLPPTFPPLTLPLNRPQDVLFGAQHLKAKTLGLPSLYALPAPNEQTVYPH